MERTPAMFAKCKEKIKGFFRWIWQECKDVKTFAILLCVVAVVYSPVWGGYLLHAIFGWKWASVIGLPPLLGRAIHPLFPDLYRHHAVDQAVAGMPHREMRGRKQGKAGFSYRIHKGFLGIPGR